MSINYKLTKYESYKNLILELNGDVVSKHYDKNLDNQIADAIGECVLCGKGIKKSSYSICCTGGNMYNFIHKSDWDSAENNRNKDGSFMGGWDIGPECYKKLKHIPKIKDYVRKDF